MFSSISFYPMTKMKLIFDYLWELLSFRWNKSKSSKNENDSKSTQKYEVMMKLKNKRETWMDSASVAESVSKKTSKRNLGGQVVKHILHLPVVWVKFKVVFLWFAVGGILIRTRAFCSPGCFSVAKTFTRPWYISKKFLTL